VKLWRVPGFVSSIGRALILFPGLLVVWFLFRFNLGYFLKSFAGEKKKDVFALVLSVGL
jgi:hypothetical protein